MAQPRPNRDGSRKPAGARPAGDGERPARAGGRPPRPGARPNTRRSGGREFGADGGGRRAPDAGADRSAWSDEGGRSARPEGPTGTSPRGEKPRGKRNFTNAPSPRPDAGDRKFAPRGPKPAHADRRNADRDRAHAPARSKVKAAIWKPGPDARVIRSENGMKLSAFVTKLFPQLSMRAARRLLEEGNCRIDGKVETFHSRLLKHGETVEIFPPTFDREHTFDPRRVLYDQDGVFVYDKPAFLPVTPTDGVKSWSLHDILKIALKADNSTLIPVHRLDADTSGVVIMAREPKLARKLEEQFRDHQVAKAYLAIVRGHPREQGLYKSYLVKVAARRGFEQWRSGRGPDAREAITKWTDEARLGSYASRVRVEPQTGRHHQIRLHFSEMGHPIYGDRIYGDRQDPIHAGRHLLHAAEAAFTHPATGERIEITAPEPAEFADAEAQLVKL